MNPTLAFWLAQGISVIAGVLAVVMLQLKNIKLMLLFQVLINLIGSANYLLMDGGSGMVLSLVAIFHAVVMYFYNVREMKPHLPVSVAFILVYFACAVYNLVVKQDLMEILPAFAAFCFSMSLVQKKPSIFRIWTLFNPVFWVPYDIYTKSYVMFLVHSGILISSIVGMIRIDGLFKKKAK